MYVVTGNRSSVSEAGVDITSCKEELEHLFADDGEFGHPFRGLESEYQQRKYFKTHFDFVVRI